jgi:CRISPR-associated protein Csm1
MLSETDQNYLSSLTLPDIQGIMPFVHALTSQLNIGYSQSFVRNLLLTAQLREQKIKAAEQNQKQAITYFLHLPKLAYTVSRLPQRVRDHPDFAPVRQSLMSPYNSPYFRAIATWIELLTRQA